MSNMANLEVAIIGCGGIASAHINQFYKIQDKIQISACLDYSEQMAEKFAKQYGIARTYTDIDELLRSEKNIFAVDVCTPPEFHVSYVRKAVAAGRHVITEKPFSLDYSEAEKAVEEAQKKNVKLMVMQNYRWRPEYVQAKSLIDANWIGKPTLITILSRHDWFAFGANEYRKKMKRMSLFELSIHYVDLFRFLLESEAKEVFAITGRRDDSPYLGDTFSAMIVQFQNGCIGNLVTSAETLGAKANWGAETVIQGTNGTLWLNRDDDYELVAYSRVFGGYMPSTIFKPSKGWFGEPLECFFDSIQNNFEPPTSGMDNLHSLKIIMAAYESSDTRKAIKLS
jgi:predicted dehydrogenase